MDYSTEIITYNHVINSELFFCAAGICCGERPRLADFVGTSFLREDSAFVQFNRLQLISNINYDKVVEVDNDIRIGYIILFITNPNIICTRLVGDKCVFRNRIFIFCTAAENLHGISFGQLHVGLALNICNKHIYLGQINSGAAFCEYI